MQSYKNRKYKQNLLPHGVAACKHCDEKLKYWNTAGTSLVLAKHHSCLAFPEYLATRAEVNIPEPKNYLLANVVKATSGDLEVEVWSMHHWALLIKYDAIKEVKDEDSDQTV